LLLRSSELGAIAGVGPRRFAGGDALDSFALRSASTGWRALTALSYSTGCALRSFGWPKLPITWTSKTTFLSPRLPRSDFIGNVATMITTSSSVTPYQIAAWIIMAIGLTLALLLHLLPIMLAGMLMVQLVHIIAPRFVIGKLSHTRSKVLVISLVTLLVLGVLGGAATAVILYLRTEGGLAGLLTKWRRSSKIRASCCPSGQANGCHKAM
jgi:hypothetical protein